MPFGQAEVFRQKRLGRVADPIADAERAELGEVAVVKNQNEMRRLIARGIQARGRGRAESTTRRPARSRSSPCARPDDHRSAHAP